MNKFNRKFNSACSRFAFWQQLSTALAGFDYMLTSAKNLTPDDVSCLKAIHRKLYECYGLAKCRVQLHQDRIKTLRKELHNGSKTINQ